MRISVELPGVVPPTATSQQKGVFVRNGHAHFFTKKNVREAENLLASLLVPHRPENPLKGALSLTVVLKFPFRKSEKKSVVASGLPSPHDNRPDLDNLLKGLIDCMTHLGFWRDDAQISHISAAKLRAPVPGIFITVTEV